LGATATDQATDIYRMVPASSNGLRKDWYHFLKYFRRYPSLRKTESYRLLLPGIAKLQALSIER